MKEKTEQVSYSALDEITHQLIFKLSIQYPSRRAWVRMQDANEVQIRMLISSMFHINTQCLRLPEV